MACRDFFIQADQATQVFLRQKVTLIGHGRCTVNKPFIHLMYVRIR